MKLKVFQIFKGKGTSTDKKQRDFDYHYKLGEMTCGEEVGHEEIKKIDNLTEGLSIDEAYVEFGSPRINYKNYSKT